MPRWSYFFLHGFLACVWLLLPVSVVSQGVYTHPKSLFRPERLSKSIDPAASLSVNTSTFTEKNQIVEVAWAGLSPGTEYLVALYVPADVDPTKSVPVHYFNATSKTRTAGTSRFKLLNMRWDFGFKLISGGYLNPVIVAEALTITNTIANMPTQAHLALHADMRSLVVSWVTAEDVAQEVQYGSQPGRYLNSTASTTSTYRATDMCGAPANSTGWMDPGYIHFADIPSSWLTPNQRFHYRYGSEAHGWSRERSALAPPAPKTSQPLKFLAFNDVAMDNALLFNNVCPPWCPGGLHFESRYGLNSTKLLPYLSTETDAQLALLVGDLSYAVGFAADWDVFGHQFEDVFTQWPLMVGTGNHERDWPRTGDAFSDTAHDSGGECNVPFAHRFYTPATAAAATACAATATTGLQRYRSYYSFNMGPVHFLVLDSESPSDPSSPQGQFVAQDLASVDRQQQPWVVVGLHRMMYAPATFRQPPIGDLDNMERLQADYEELFMRHQVDVVVQGHEHAYARTCPVYRRSCVGDSLRSGFGQASAPVYILAGHAGAGFTHGFPHRNMPSWVVSGAQDRNGYLRFQVTRTTLIMEAVSSDDGSIMDTMTLTKAAAASW